MSGMGPGRRLSPGERTVIIRVGMPESLVQRVDQAVAESILRTDRSKWIVAQIVAALQRHEDVASPDSPQGG